METKYIQDVLKFRYPELFKLPDTTESLYSDRNSSYDNVERRQDSRIFHTMTTTSTMTTNLTSSTPTEEPRHELNRYEPSESDTLLDTDDSDLERVRRSRSFRDQILGEFFLLFCTFQKLSSFTVKSIFYCYKFNS